MKKSSRIASVLLSLALVLSMMSISAFAAETTAAYNGGFQDEAINIDGVAYNFVINNAADLTELEAYVESAGAGSANNVSVRGVVNVLLMNDITTPAGWDGIGVPQSFIAYCGTFNGNGHTITTNVVNSANVGPKGGLFNLTANAADGTTTEIKDLIVTGSVTSNRFIGGLVGRVMGSLTIENCSVDLTLTLNNGASNSIGGLIGQCGSGAGTGGGGGTGGTSSNTSGTITVMGCNVSGAFESTTPSNPVGGVFGHIYSGYTVNIYATKVAASLKCDGGTVAAFVGNNAATSLSFYGCSYLQGIADKIIGTGTLTYSGVTPTTFTM